MDKINNNEGAPPAPLFTRQLAPDRYKIIFRFVAIGVIVILLIIIFVALFLQKNAYQQLLQSANNFNAVKSPIQLESTKPYLTAEDKARRWKPDARLSFITTEPVGSGQFAWRYIFISSSTPKKGLFITVNESKGAIAAEEQPYYGAGGNFNPTKLLTAEEAMERALRIPGNEYLKIVGVEAVYGPNGQIWYWGVKTNRGVITIEARKQ